MMSQITQFVKSITVLIETILAICKTEEKNNRKEKLEECARKIEKNLQYSKTNETENNKKIEQNRN